ncbi:YfhL family 4Fe-4S dicluster ferredoxin [Georgfuchsia toluolica]|uniref:YfhL family 4Fe-4S dicluster ferredoxin n=1 Tax=Georgfuchsia toluolica TaxID=424218 RepID=UPI0031B82012
MINSDCISCDACVPECPNGAISAGEEAYAIDPTKCTECVGHFDKSQCIQVCPVDSIVSDPNNLESKDQLQEKFLRLATT